MSGGYKNYRYTKSIFDRLVRAARLNEAVQTLTALDPADVYAALLDHVTVMGWKRGKAFYEFRDIFGRKPNRDEQNVEPRQLSEHEHIVAQWFELRPKRKPKRT
jgi:hypothetical protein